MTMPSEPLLARPPRELILASAGSGKTYRISSRIIALLAQGAPPDTILAATFTRKAAGELLERVLLRLAEAALDPDAAAQLARDTDHAGTAPASTDTAALEAMGSADDCAFWVRVLERVVRSLHRLNIGTLDAFFVRAARSFAHDLGMPPAWQIADEPTATRVRAEALGDVLRETDAAVLVELVRDIGRRSLSRSVHDGLLRRTQDLVALHDALEPGADGWSAWHGAIGSVAGADEGARLGIAAAMEALPLPLTNRGQPRKNWQTCMRDAADAVRRGDWDALLELTLCQRVLTGGTEYDRQPIDDAVRARFEEACALARTALAARLAAQAAALGRFVAMYAAALAARRAQSGAFRFDDITRMLGGPDPLGARPDLYFRLDMQTRHILLDEFQDTSLAQWEALEPLLGELLAGDEDERAAVIVADPKQSIYAWRGATPALVEHVRTSYTLAADTLATSWRSSPAVLDTVNHVFDSLEQLPIWADDDVGARTASAWKSTFSEHVAAEKNAALPGYVQLLVGPHDEGSGEARPNLCRAAATLVARQCAAAAAARHGTGLPRATIGVLTRKNETVARIMLELKRLGINASGEGGNPLTDAAAVTSLLELLRLADHPGDRVARYHVTMTPVGRVVELADYNDVARACAVAHRLRGDLLERGYGDTVAALARAIRDDCDTRERRRLAQLVELAFRYDSQATLRVMDFVRLVEQERVEDPTDADVRVMTVHQAKGLEFDVVVLPELDAPLLGRGSAGTLAYRPDPAGRVTKLFPYVARNVQPLFEDIAELRAAREQAHAAALRDALSGLYVGLTRARHALFMLIKPDGARPSTARTSARIVREALARDVPADEDAVLYEHGDVAWALRHAEQVVAARAAVARREPAAGPLLPAPALNAPVGPVPLRAATTRTRSLPRRSPSDLEGGETVDLRVVLRLDGAASAERGTIAHNWFEQVGWIEDGVPDDATLRAVAQRVAPALDDTEVTALLGRFRDWLATPAIRAALARAAYAGLDASVEREVPFIRRDGDTVVEGSIDRLVLVREAGRVTRADIIDFKTDAVAADDEPTITQRAGHYRPQLDAYRRAVAAEFGIDTARVTARLVFVHAGRVVGVGS